MRSQKNTNTKIRKESQDRLYYHGFICSQRSTNTKVNKGSPDGSYYHGFMRSQKKTNTKVRKGSPDGLEQSWIYALIVEYQYQGKKSHQMD